MVGGNRTKSTENILIVYVIVVVFSVSCGTGNHSSHLLRHHQQQQQQLQQQQHESGWRKSSEDLENLNETERKNWKIPDLVVKPREEIYLNCYLPQTTLENIGFAVTWLHNGLIVDAAEMGSMSNGHRYFRDPTNGQLFISSIRLEDDGLWHCQYQGRMLDRPISSNPLKLVVLDKPRSPYLLVDGRRLDPGNAFLPVKESLELTLTCVVEGGNPRPSIKWLILLSSNLDPVLLGEDSRHLTLNVTENGSGTDANTNRVFSQEQTRSEATIASVQRVHHNATVVCIVDHVTLKSPLNASTLLDVQYAPSFAISREPGFGFPLREGMSVSLKCDVDSNPPSNPVWLKDDGLPLVSQSIDGFLNFTSIKREHSGWYKCTSHNLLGEFSSIGYFLNVRNGLANISQDPAVEQQPTGRQVEVPLGGMVQLQCPEEAMGCWSRVGVNGRLEPVGPGPGLLLTNIIYQDAGEYRCVSSKRGKYDRWRSEVNVDVTVKGRPVVYPPESVITGTSGQTLDFVLEYCANPPTTRAFWITETQRLRPGQVTEDFIAQNVTPSSSIHCLNAVLTLKQVRASHSGEYMFLVKSPLGVSQGTIQLNVTADFGCSSSGNGVLIVFLSTALLIYVSLVF